MRILITNDDGVFAPGIEALARGLLGAFGEEHELLVAAPLTDWSGASSAVGAVWDRESIPFESVDIPGLSRIPVYAVDGPPALCVILACIGGFGPQPDLVVSGINHGVNIGRSALHSGTVGAALTAAQFGLRALAVSVGWHKEDVFWDTAIDLVTRIVPGLIEQEPRTVLNLNVPAVSPEGLKGVRHGNLGTIGLIRSVARENSARPVEGQPIDRTSGAITLTIRDMGGMEGGRDERVEAEPTSDAAALHEGWASLTPIVGVREDFSEAGQAALKTALAALGVTS
jgi:5'-nucleotidase